VYGEDVMAPLRKIWAVMDAPTGKRLAPFPGEMVAVLERAGELDLEPEVRATLVAMSAQPSTGWRRSERRCSSRADPAPSRGRC